MDITKTQKANTLLVVDDELVNLKLLISCLEDHYKVVVAHDGEEALAEVHESKPDLILMDVRMPKLDGFEACRRLKADTQTKNIPVIFMTALTDTGDKIKGFEAGAVDYLTKPVHYQEMLSRINAHLSLRNLQVILSQQNAAIEQKNLELQIQNMEMNALAQVVISDLKKPLVRQAGFTNVLVKELAKLPNQEPLNFLEEVEESRQKMVEVVDDMVLLVNVRSQEVVMEAPDMAAIIAQVRHRLGSMIKKFHGNIVTPTTWPIVWGYSPWIEKVWEIYISNALEYGGMPPKVEVGSTPDGESIRFWVRDNGRGFTSEQKDHLFVPLRHFDQSGTLKKGYGLKLSLVRRLIEKCGGQVGVETKIGRGSTFYFTLRAIA
jgi:DNA-binding response OmpR family regulator